MQGQNQIEALVKKALSFSEADETEVLVTSEDSSLTRFANNFIHQNVAESNTNVTIKAVVGQRVGTASTNNLSEEGLAKTAARALLHAQQQPPDPDFPGLPRPQMVMPVESFDDETAGFSPADRAEAVGEICRMAIAEKLTAFGAYETKSQEVAVGNSHGVMVYHPGTMADLQATISGDNGSGRSQASGWQVRDIDPNQVGREAVEKAKRAQNPQAIDPGEYTVILDPYAVQDIVSMLNFSGFSAQAVQEGRSWMNDRIGQQAMSPLVTIWDDGRDPAGSPLPFDFEGLPRQRVVMVEKGVIRTPVYDRYTAKKESKETTGHAPPPWARFFTGPMAFHIFMGSGGSSVEEMIKSTEKGLYITRFWYTRPVHPRDCVITGMTRDGVMMIENGELTFPVKDLRFTQSYLNALADVEAVGREQKTLFSSFGGSAVVPALKIKKFNFTGRTT